MHIQGLVLGVAAAQQEHRLQQPMLALESDWGGGGQE